MGLTEYPLLNELIQLKGEKADLEAAIRHLKGELNMKNAENERLRESLEYLLVSADGTADNLNES
jgi:hypothetical protein